MDTFWSIYQRGGIRSEEYNYVGNGPKTRTNHVFCLLQIQITKNMCGLGLLKENSVGFWFSLCLEFSWKNHSRCTAYNYRSGISLPG
jgi:hypothetical protein